MQASLELIHKEDLRYPVPLKILLVGSSFDECTRSYQKYCDEVIAW